MSRHGYSEDAPDDAEQQWACIRYAGALKSAKRGKRGQAFFVELVKALDAMPEKRLIVGKLEDGNEVCALGALGRARGIDMRSLDLEDEDGDEDWNHELIGDAFGVARHIACEVMYENDEACVATPEERWKRVRAYALRQIRPETLVPEKP